MRTILALCLATTLSFSAATARADAETSKRSQELVTLLMPKEAYERSIEQMTVQMLASVRAQGQSLPAGAEEKMKAAVLDVMPYQEMLTWTAEIYAKKFTAKELGDLIAFYKTPTGRKTAKLLPDIMGEAGAKMGQVMPQRLPAALKKHGLTP